MSRKTRNLMWSVPLIAAVAVIGALAIFMTQAPAPASAHGLPGPVNNLKAEATGRHSIMLSWTKPATGGDPTGYRVDQSKDNRIWSVHTHNTGSTATSLEITEGVTPATRLHFRVFALNSAGTGPVSEDPVTAFVDVNEDHPPVAPGELTLTATVKGHNQIDLTWTEPTYNGGADVSAYNLRWTVTNATADQTVVTTPCGTPETAGEQQEPCQLAATTKTDDRAYSHKSLQAGETYYYQVSVTAGGGTTYSNVVGATTRAVASPSRPQDFVAVVAATNIELYWNEPASNGGHTLRAAPLEADNDLQYKFRPAADNATDAAINTWTTIAATACDNATAGCNVTVAPTQGDGSYEFRLRARQNNEPADAGLNQASAYVTSRAVMRPAETATTENRKQPGQPSLTATVLEAMTETEQGIRLTWEKYDDTSDAEKAPNPDDYRIDFARVPKPDTGANNAGTANPGKWMRLQYFLITLGEYDHEGLAAGDKYFYRILAKNGNHYGTAAIADGIVTAAVIQSGANQGSPLTLTATALSATKIKLDWSAMPGVSNPRYCVQAAEVLTTGNVGAAGAYAALTSMPIASRTYTDTLDGPGSQKWYRVYREGGTDTDCGAPTVNAPPAAGDDTVYPPQRAMTPEAGSPGKPFGLVVEEAKDSSLLGPTARGVLLLWAEPTEKDKDIVTGYEVQRKIDAAEWDSIVRDTSKPTAAMGQWTHHNDEDEIGTVTGHADEKQRAYRVRALSGNGKGDWSDTAYYPDMHLPGMPASLTAEKDMDMPGTKVNLTWTAPDMNAANVDGYIIERAYGDVMFLNMADGVVHPNYAFSDHMEWWETLDCNGMLKAVGSTETKVETPAADSDQAMYCKHYAMSGPTASMTFPAEKQIAAGSETDMKIEMYFDKRYEVITDASTMMHTDTVMENTEYSYRVRATHDDMAGMWSATATVMTTMDNSAPVVSNAIGAVEVEVGETSAKMDLNMYFNDPDGETLTYTAMSNDTAIATYGIGDGEPFDHLEPNELEITGEGVGETTITVTATDAAGESVSQNIMVTVVSGELTKPMVTATPGEGSVMLSWDMAGGAISYTVAGVRTDGSAVRTTEEGSIIWMPGITATEYEVTDLHSGAEYFFVVAACGNEGCTEYLWSDLRTVTTE